MLESRHAQRLGALAVEHVLDLRRAHVELREDAGQFRALVGLPQEILEHAGELLDIAAAAIFQDELEAAGGADARNRRRIQRQYVGLLDSARQPVDARRQRERRHAPRRRARPRA